MKKPLMTVGYEEIVSSKTQEYKIERDWYKLGLENIEDVLSWDIEDNYKILKIIDIVKVYIDGEPRTVNEFNESQEMEGKELSEEFKQNHED
jgi:hypothetical protein